MRSVTLVLLALAVLAPRADGQNRQPIGFDSFLSLKTVGDPRVSPDGATVAFTVTTPSLTDNRNVSRIWLVPVAGGAARPLSAGPGTDYAPRWAPDGRSLAFISTRGGSPQVWRASLMGGDATPVTALENGVNDFVWTPDGTALIASSDVKWPGEQEIDRRNGEFPTSARIWTDLFYRHWNEWRVGTRQHVFRITLSGGPAVDLTPIDHDVPTLALGGSDIAVSPSGEVAVVFNPDSVVATSTNNDLFLLGRGTPTPLTDSRANDHSPAFSPDGRTIAYLAMATPGFEADRTQLILLDRGTGSRRSLTANWDVSVQSLAWTPDGRSLLVEIEERGTHPVYRIDVASGARSLVVAGGQNGALRVTPDGRTLVFLRQSATQPPEIYAVGLDGQGLRAVTTVNAATLAGLDLAPLEPFGFVGAQGDSVFGWMLKPPGFVPGRKYPMLYLVHGGPQGAWLDNWSARWNYHMFASRGYVVAAVNFHGSTGYGQAFTNSITRNWGGAPFEDLMKGLDRVAAMPFVDSTRMGAAGASYGGYMIFWLAGHTKRFKMLVAHDGVFNPLSMAGSTEELWFPLWEFGGAQTSRDGRALMQKWSPEAAIANWQTPMLVVHGQQDFRVDVSEGYQAFTALKLKGIPAKFLYFPDEGHWVLKPRNRRIWWGVVLDWADSYLAK
jgi:dipeptidyl aminopeptidase/acylaminoacyl peptidase